MTTRTRSISTSTNGRAQSAIDAMEGPDVHDGIDYAYTEPTRDVTAEVGPGHDDDFIFDTSHGQIRIRSMAKGKNPPPFAMMKAEAEKNYSRMTLLVLKVKAGDDWPRIEGILEQLDEDEFKAFSEGWAAHSGVSTGE
jgi:hypothetical protein